MNKRRGIFVVALAGVMAATVSATAAGGGKAGPLSARITACSKVVKVGTAKSFYYKCVGPFTFGIPAASQSVAFYIDGTGSFSKGDVVINIVDPKTMEPLTSPVVNHLTSPFPRGFSWWFGFNGPFPKQTIAMTVTFKGKKIGGPFLFRFV